MLMKISKNKIDRFVGLSNILAFDLNRPPPLFLAGWHFFMAPIYLAQNQSMPFQSGSQIRSKEIPKKHRNKYRKNTEINIEKTPK
jgi:hypothetical protein